MYQVTVVWYTIYIYIYIYMYMYIYYTICIYIYVYIYMAYPACTACIGMLSNGNWLRARWRCHEIVKVAPWRIRRGHPDLPGICQGWPWHDPWKSVENRMEKVSPPNPPRSSITRHPKLQISPAEEVHQL